LSLETCRGGEINTLKKEKVRQVGWKSTIGLVICHYWSHALKCVETHINSLSLSLSAVMLEYSVLLFSAIHCYKHCINITNSAEESFSSEGSNPRNWSPEIITRKFITLFIIGPHSEPDEPIPQAHALCLQDELPCIISLPIFFLKFSFPFLLILKSADCCEK
jgi:hypothetical protein